jgi:hypothetical protein
MLRISLFPHQRGPRLLSEASTLEDQLGAEAAIAVIRDKIASADRSTRRRLYRLHDEIARRNERLYPTEPGGA